MVLRRTGLLALRKKIGTEAWIKWVEDKKIEEPEPNSRQNQQFHTIYSFL